MSFVALSLLACALMGLATWASNIWPGEGSFARAALSRAVWWGIPFGLVVWLNGAPPGNAALLGVAAWLGAWVPHTASLPNSNVHWLMALVDLAVLVLRVVALLTPPTVVFWLCGANWAAMVVAAAVPTLCVLLAQVLPHGWPGLRDVRQVAGVLFGVSTGFWLAVAVWVPTTSPDLLP